MIVTVALAWLASATAPLPGPAKTSSMVVVGPGQYAPMDQPRLRPRVVARFTIDATPVTNAEFLAFVRANPEWRRDRVKRLFAEPLYLASWRGPTEIGDAVEADAPVVEVSWFAAEAFCTSVGKRLPSEAEWELTAAASTSVKDARTDPKFLETVLGWYGARPQKLGPVGRSVPNAWGVYDMHTLVWEWVADFTSSLSPTDPRGGSDAAFCGSASGSTADVAAYASFMRRAFRSSLEGSYALPTLGFRCAKDAGSSTSRSP